MVGDDQGNTSEELLASALVANIHRQDLEELDEARALQRLLAVHGSQHALAKRLYRSQGWGSQRLALLNLTPKLQARIGEEPIDLLRAVGNRPQEEQEGALRELKAERVREEAEKQAAKSGKRADASVAAGTRSDRSGDYGVIRHSPQPPRPGGRSGPARGASAQGGRSRAAHRLPRDGHKRERRRGGAERPQGAVRPTRRPRVPPGSQGGVRRCLPRPAPVLGHEGGAAGPGPAAGTGALTR